MRSRSSIWPLAAALSLAAACSAGAAGPASAPASPSPSARAVAPELAPGTTWRNAGGATSLAALRGRVVYVQFAFLH
jgi:hypothetical protein